MNITSKVKLNNGVEIPRLGLGTYLCDAGKEVFNSVSWALEAGYRHFDTAAFYQNEIDIGKAIRNSGINRNEIFVTTKVWNTDQGFDSTMRAFDESMSKLDVGYIDLYLVHWPLEKKRLDTWKAMEKLYQTDKCRAIGVSNYTIKHLEELKSYADVVPVVNQIEFSPYLYQKELQDYCESNGIMIQAYTPLVRGKKFKHPKLVEMSRKYSKTPAQILIRWALQVNTIVIPKSSQKNRIIENAFVYDFNISDEDMQIIASFNCNFRTTWDPTDVE